MDPQRPRGVADPGDLLDEARYRRLFFTSALVVSLVTLAPLGIMSGISYRQYHDAFREDLTEPMLRFAQAGDRSLESHLSERLSGLAEVIRDTPFDELRDPRTLRTILERLHGTYGGMVDLAVVRDDGAQVAYAGPYPMREANHGDTGWFRQVATRGRYVSDLIRDPTSRRPEMLMAVRGQRQDGGWFVLRAGMDADVFHWLVRHRTAEEPSQGSACRRCHSLSVPSVADAFVINDRGILQTPSLMYGDVLEKAPLPTLPSSADPRLAEISDEAETPLLAAYAGIESSPFILVVLSPRDASHTGWQSLRRELLVVPLAGGLLILLVILGGTGWAVGRLREADRKRAVLFRQMEYTNKLAAIGRLGAGVAHEINNPVSIISEKAGLLHDRLTMTEEMPSRDQILEIVDSIQRSAERCGAITHRLLGFARHMDVERVPVDLEEVLREVLSFLEKEAAHREIRIQIEADQDTPPVVSDRGQLQQVFLNIINNAFGAVDDEGCIEVEIGRRGPDRVAVSIRDDGEGIPQGNLEQIFDPFFTTRKGSGTGLGLSITYGIVKKLGGEIEVESAVGEGTRFTVVLPIEPEEGRG